MIKKLYAKTFVLVSALVLVAACMPQTASATRNPLPDKAYYVVTQNYSLCVTVYSAQNNALVEINTCSGLSRQKIRFSPVGTSGSFMLKPDNAPNKCLSIEGGSEANGARLLLWPCQGTYNQYFFIVPTAIGGDYVAIQAMNSSKYLQVHGGVIAPGKLVTQWDYINPLPSHFIWRLIEL